MWEGDGGDILADGGHGLCGWGWMRGVVVGFYGGEEGGFAGVVETEEEDRIFFFTRGVEV